MQIAILRGGALGDIIITLPILGALRAFYPRCTLTLAGPFPQANLAAGYVDRVLDLNSSRLVGLFTAGSMIPDEVRGDLTADLILSYLSDPSGIVRQRMLALRGPAAQFIQGPFRLDLESRPAVQQLAQPLRILGIPLADPVPRLAMNFPKPLFIRLAIHPGSGSPNKNWPLNRWADLVAQLMPAFDDVLLVSGEADTDVTRALVPLLPANKVRLCSNRSLSDLVAELGQATLFVGHDTGVTHLAAAIGVRTVALFGPTDPTIWAPPGDHITVVRSPDRTMTGLSVEAVLETIETA